MKIFFLNILLIFIIQNNFSQSKNIKGIIVDGNELRDSISFISGFINPNYFENPKISEKIYNHEFKIYNKFSLPQMYKVIIKNKSGDLTFHESFYFLDKSTKSITIDSNLQNTNVVGKTGNEFNNIFTPFFFNKIDADNNFDKQIWDNGNEFDSKLLNYTKKHPNSYVSLWFLILRFHLLGYSDLRLQILNSFSDKIKIEKLWETAMLEFDKVKIKENKKFPELDLKNVDLSHEKLILPKAEYTLIDFWFSRCKPCLEQLPSLIEIYSKNKSKGFNIISISVDRTENVLNYWQKRIIEKGIPWKNYLDENGTIATQEKIISFPSNFLLNSKGEIIKKNISLEELEILLKEKLK